MANLLNEIREEIEREKEEEKNKKLYRYTNPIIGYIAIILWFFVCIGAVIVFSLLIGG